MGIFNKTEEELKKEETTKKLRLVSDAIANNEDLLQAEKDYLFSYISKLRKGYPNDFDDLDTFIQIVTKLIEDSYDSYDSLEEHFEEIKTLYHKMINKESPNYNRDKELFISYFVGPNGLIYKDLFDETLYATFQNKEDYYEIINIIYQDPYLSDHLEIIKDYIQRVSKFCLNQDVLKRDIISYLAGFNDVLGDQYDKYSRDRLEEAKRRIGVYNISPKDIASADTKLRRVESYLDQFSTYMTNLKEQQKSMNSLIEAGKKDIKKTSKDSIEQLKQIIDIQKQALLEKLDAYLLDLEEVLKNKSDETFQKIIETYKGQINEFRNIFKGYSMAASKDLIAIQEATQDSIKTLQTYVTNEPQLQKLLTQAQEQNTVREKIVELVTKEEQLLDAGKKTTPTEQVVIPGFERIMVPYRHIILPERITSDIIPALDERIPFDQRIKEVEKRMKEKEAEGEIYHKKVLQIAIDIMEGDWPYLWGPSGTGKSYMVKQVADLLGMDLMKAGKITEPHSILGYNDPQGRYRITPTFMAALYGYLLSLDEFDNGNPDTQIVLNDIYSELLNKIDNPDEECEVMFGDDIPVNVHPNFRMIAAGNTSGEGENSVFSSRGKIDESIQERMTPIYIDYDDRVEKLILKDYPEWYDFFISFRRACSQYAANSGLETPQGTTTTRDATAIKKYVEHNSKTLDQIIFERFIQIKDSEYRKALGKLIANMYSFDYSSCNDQKFNGPIKKAEAKVLAKKFVYYCKKGVE